MSPRRSSIMAESCSSCVCSTKVRITLSVVGVVVGLSVFPVFGFVYGNWAAAVWGLTSGLFAAMTMYVHIKYALTQWKTSPHCLRGLMYSGCMGQLAGVCGFVAYLTLAITQNQGLVVEGPGYYITCIWCFMTWKWGFLLFLSSREYRRLYQQTTGLPSDVPYQKV